MKRMISLIGLILSLALTTQVIASEKLERVATGNDPMVLEFDTTIDIPEMDDNEIEISLSGEVDAIIDWGDGNTTPITESSKISHIYDTPGIYTVSISGELQYLGYTTQFIYGGEPEYYYQKLTKVHSYGEVDLKGLGFCFSGSHSLIEIPDQFPETVTDLYPFLPIMDDFRFDVTGWDMSNITYTYNLFKDQQDFNQDISGWDMSSVEYLTGMFENCISFNQDINSWDVGNVVDMTKMFKDAISFNKPLNNWDMNKVLGTGHMFENAVAFNQPLDSWDFTVFMDCRDMFHNATAFNQPLDSWNVSNVIYFQNMFKNATSFNQPLNSWNMDSAEDISSMFSNATQFNQDISGWNMGKVKLMTNMFNGATNFNQNLNSWKVSSVERMYGMFKGALSFDQSLSEWNLSSIITILEFLGDIEISITNYDETLIGWANNPDTPDNLSLTGGLSQYSSASASARTYLEDSKGWNFYDGGFNGTISNDIFWNGGLIEVEDDITILEGATLSIAPGTVIKFKGDYYIDIQGRILAEGSHDDKIIFESDYYDGWRGLRFINNQDDPSLLSNCIIRNVNLSSAITIIDENGIDGTHVSIIDVVVEENDIEIDGGGLYVNGGDIEVINTIFADNHADGNGGAIYMENSSSMIINCTIIGNSCNSNGGAIALVNSDTEIYNSIIWHNSTDGAPNQIHIEGTDISPSFFYSNIEGGFDGFTGSGSGANFMGAYENNIDEDPKFNQSKSGYNYTVSENSPCINSGTIDIEGYQFPEYDIIGNDRIYPELVDMGAFEYSSASIEDENIADSFILYQNFPNPFNPTTTISFNIPSHFSESLSLLIFNIKGEMVEKIKLSNLSQGSNSIDLNMGNHSSGVFFYKLDGAGFNQMRKMVLCK